jgi:hypothetical protein
MPEISTQVVAIDKVVAKVEKQESLGRIGGALEFCIYGARAAWIASKRQTVVNNMPIRFCRVVCKIRRCADERNDKIMVEVPCVCNE